MILSLGDPSTASYWIGVALFAGAFSVVCILALFMGEIFRDVWNESKKKKNTGMAALIILGLGGALTGVCEKHPYEPPVVTDKGIQLYSVEADAHRVRFDWSVNSTNIVLGTTLFHIQARRTGIGVPTQWFDLGTTTATNYTHTGFTVGQTFRYRILVDLQEGAQ